MGVPVLVATPDYGWARSNVDGRQFINFGRNYAGTYSQGITRSKIRMSVKFSREPAKAQPIYDLLDTATYKPGYFRWQAPGDVPRYWTVDPESLDMTGDAYGRWVVSAKLTEWLQVGGVV